MTKFVLIDACGNEVLVHEGLRRGGDTLEGPTMVGTDHYFITATSEEVRPYPADEPLAWISTSGKLFHMKQ